MGTRTGILLAAIAAFSFPVPGVSGQEPRKEASALQAGPSLRKTDRGVEITFALAGPTDVTVRVCDGDGRVLRHLASGVAGLERAAKPLAPGSLRQTILWDGKDDAGKAVEPAGGKVSVAVGMRAKFHKFILHDPDGFDLGRGSIFPGRDGEFLVAQDVGVHFSTLRVFNREGKFVRCLWPFSLDRPKEAIEPFLRNPAWGADDWAGRRVPVSINHNAWYKFGPRSPEIILTTDGHLIGINGYGSDYVSLWQLTPDGLPGAWCWHPPWYKRIQDTGFDRKKWRLAAGQDGDLFLADAGRHVVGHFRASDLSPIPSFTRSGSKRLDAPRHYLGEVGEAGEDDSHFRGPDGIALGQDGNLLVPDGGALRSYSKDGALIAETQGLPLARPAFPQALLDSGKKKVLAFPHFLRVDAAGRLYVRNCSRAGPFIETDADGTAFKPHALPWGVSSAQGYGAFDAEGNWYVSVHRGRDEVADSLWKFAPDGHRLKFGDKDELSLAEGVHEIKGIAAARNGDLYLVTALSRWKMPKEMQKLFGKFGLKGDEFNFTRVDLYGADGTLKQKGLVRSQGLNDVALDRGGNLYVIEATMWHGAQMAGLARRGGWPFAYATSEAAKLSPTTEANKRFSLMGRLLKFAPAGGTLDGEGAAGPLWVHAGVSGLSPWACGGECFAGQVCVDADDRVWVPDTFLYSILALDTAGNPILRVGTYGSEDCKGGGGDRALPGTAIVRDPEIPLARPSGMAVWRDYLFISDLLAHRVVRCRLDYAEVKELPLPGYGP